MIDTPAENRLYEGLQSSHYEWSLEEWELTPYIDQTTYKYFDDSNSFPAGRYKVKYLDGCINTNTTGPERWTVNEPIGGGALHGYQIYHSEGTVLDFPRPGDHSEDDTYATQAECKATYRGTGTYFDHTGGVIGMHLADNDYSDNAAGQPAPTFRLTFYG
jgi:hypothetical protein